VEGIENIFLDPAEVWKMLKTISGLCRGVEGIKTLISTVHELAIGNIQVGLVREPPKFYLDGRFKKETVNH
jgi:hypothetical protein